MKRVRCAHCGNVPPGHHERCAVLVLGDDPEYGNDVQEITPPAVTQRISLQEAIDLRAELARQPSRDPCVSLLDTVIALWIELEATKTRQVDDMTRMSAIHTSVIYALTAQTDAMAFVSIAVFKKHLTESGWKLRLTQGTFDGSPGDEWWALTVMPRTDITLREGKPVPWKSIQTVAETSDQHPTILLAKLIRDEIEEQNAVRRRRIEAERSADPRLVAVEEHRST